MDKIKTESIGDLTAYTLAGVTIIFRRGADPVLKFGDQLVKIDSPDRFGDWDTPMARHDFVRAFVAAQSGK